ncbi:MAG: porin family protein [Chitinophagales bacterium]
MRVFGLLFLTFFITVSAHAEVGVLAGARAGMNVCNLRKFTAPTDFSKKMLLGSDIAAQLRIDFNKFIGLQLEVEFAQKGQAWKRTQDSAKYYGKTVLSYVQFPLLAVARFGSDKYKAIIQVGPYVGYWVGGYSQSSVQIDKVTRESTNSKYLFTKDDNRVDVGLAVGLGTDIKIGKGYIEIGARYNVGFLATAKKNTALPKVYNSNFSISLGYLYTIK